jgi:hypothetical protein
MVSYPVLQAWKYPSAKDYPWQCQYTKVCCHIERRISVIEGWLVETGTLGSLVPVIIDRTALEEEPYCERSLLHYNPCSETMQR